MKELFEEREPVMPKRGVHLDLKGLPPTPERMVQLLKACYGNMYHGTWENHKASRVDDLLAGRGPEDAFPAFERWRKS